MPLRRAIASTRSRASIAFIALLALTASTRYAQAQAVSDGGAELEEVVARDSPRASIRDFLDLCRAGDFVAAAEYLELAPELRERGPELARRLKAVIDRKAWIELEALSPLTTGNTADGLPPNTDEIGRVPGAEGGIPEPIRIVRGQREGQRWRFSNATVKRIDGWYVKLGARWLLERLPAPLLATGPRSLMWWQWIALPLLTVVAWAVAAVLGFIASRVLTRLAARTVSTWDDAMVERVERPLRLWWTLAVVYMLLPALALNVPAEKFVLSMMHTIFLIGVFWVLARSIDVGAQLVLRSPWGTGHDTSRSLISLGSRVAKIALMAIAIVALLSQLGYPIASILAGLGVGGLAVALAAQKTVENLFGAFSIGADQPFREGDFVKVDDFMGTVEHVGLRSTRFRTLERTLISIPNGKLAEMKIETFAARDRLRFAMTVQLVRSSSSAQVREVIEGIEGALWQQPKLFPGSAIVRFDKFGPSSLDLEVVAYFDTRELPELHGIRQELLLEFMRVIEHAGTSLAVPAASVHLDNALEIARSTSARGTLPQPG